MTTKAKLLPKDCCFVLHFAPAEIVPTRKLLADMLSALSQRQRFAFDFKDAPHCDLVFSEPDVVRLIELYRDLIQGLDCLISKDPLSP